MEGKKVFIGIDVGKTNHYLVALDETGDDIYHREFGQSEKQTLSVLAQFKGFDEVLVALDQPHNIGALVVRCAQSLGYEVAFLPSKTMRKYAEARNITSKTDKVDAYVIAQCAYKDPELLRAVVQPDEHKALLRTLKKRDRDLADDKTKTINRLRAALLEDMPEFEAILKENRLDCPFMLETLKHFHGPWGIKTRRKAFNNFCARFSGKIPSGLIKDIFDVIDSVHLNPVMSQSLEQFYIPQLAQDLCCIKKRRDEISRQIQELLKDDEDYQILCSLPGIGEKLASQMISEIDIDRFSSADELACYAGLAPKVRQSGTSINSSFAAKGGNHRLKNAFFMAARCSAQYSAVSQAYYQKKRNQGKSYAGAHMALARRLCKVIYAMLKNKTPYSYEAPLRKVA